MRKNDLPRQYRALCSIVRQKNYYNCKRGTKSGPALSNSEALQRLFLLSVARQPEPAAAAAAVEPSTSALSSLSLQPSADDSDDAIDATGKLCFYCLHVTSVDIETETVSFTDPEVAYSLLLCVSRIKINE